MRNVRRVLAIALVLILALATVGVYACGIGIQGMEVNGLSNGGPTVIFDSGYGDGIYAYSMGTPDQRNWGTVPSQVDARTIEFDRIGLGLSTETTPVSGKLALDRARQLHQALRDRHLHGPYIYVGHSMGNFTARAFNHLYPREVYGFVSVDGTAPGEATWIVNWVQANMPQDFIDAFFAQFGPADGSYQQVIASENQVMNMNFGHKPCTIIYCTNQMGVPEGDEAHCAAQIAQAASISTNSTVIASDCGNHYIQLTDDSSIVVNAINAMIEEYRSEQ